MQVEKVIKMRKTLTLWISLLALVVSGVPIRSNIGAKNIGFIEEETTAYTAADYVQDGLVAMWDGIENVGVGIHDSSAQCWIDLTGNGYDIDFTKNIRSGTIFFRKDRVYVNGAVTITNNPIVMSNRPNSPPSAILQYHTFEVCFRYIKLNSANTDQIFGCRVAGINSCVGYFMPWCIYTRSNGYWDIGLQRRWSRNSIFSSGTPLSLSIVQDSDTYSFFLNSLSVTTDHGGYNYDMKTPVLFSYFNSSEGSDGQIEIMNGRLYSRVLTEEEISYNYTIDKARFNLP
jgi:hypothetical protein